MMRIYNEEGRPFDVRIVRPGGKYGLGFTLTWPDPNQPFEVKRAAAGDVMIEFWDAMTNQFVARYYRSTLVDTVKSGRSLQLEGSVREWRVTAANVLDALLYACKVPE